MNRQPQKYNIITLKQLYSPNPKMKKRTLVSTHVDNKVLFQRSPILGRSFSVPNPDHQDHWSRTPFSHYP